MSTRKILMIAICMVIGFVIGIFFFSGTAKAQYYPNVCAYLDMRPNVAGVEDLVVIGVRGGMTPYDAGQEIGATVRAWCPRHLLTLDAYVAKWS